MGTMALQRTLTFPFLFLYGIGMILGAGIYSVIGVAAADAGEGLWISFLLAGLIAMVTGLSYAELASLFPKAGAEYVYVRATMKKGLHKGLWVGNAVGLLVAFAGASTAATVAVAFAGYLENFVALPAIPVALALVALLTVVNIVGIKESSWANALFTMIEVGGLFLFIWLGLRQGGMLEPVAKPELSTALLATTGVVIFSYFGFENMVNLAEESKKPERDLPLAICLSLGIATVLYVLVSLALVNLIDPAALKGNSSPLVAAAKQGSAWAGGTLGGVALFSTANTALIALISSSRILFSMGRDKEIPAVFGKTLRKRKTPWAGALAVAICAMALIPFGGVKVLASVSSFSTLLAFNAVNLAVILFRFWEPAKKRPFRVPLAAGKLPLLPVLGIAANTILLFQFEAGVYWVGIPVITGVLLAAFLWSRVRA